MNVPPNEPEKWYSRFVSKLDSEFRKSDIALFLEQFPKILLGILILGLVLFTYKGIQLLVFAKYGVEIKATVTAKFEEPSIFSALNPVMVYDMKPDCYLVVTYHTAEGKTYTTDYRTNRSYWESVPLNGKTDIIYLKNHPVYILGENEGANTTSWLIIALLFSIFYRPRKK